MFITLRFSPDKNNTNGHVIAEEFEDGSHKCCLIPQNKFVFKLLYIYVH